MHLLFATTNHLSGILNGYQKIASKSAGVLTPSSLREEDGFQPKPNRNRVARIAYTSTDLGAVKRWRRVERAVERRAAVLATINFASLGDSKKLPNWRKRS